MISDSKKDTNNIKFEMNYKISSQMSINVENVYRIAERLAFPRLISSEGEKKAIEIIIDEFKKVGYTSIYQDKFKTCFYNWIILRYVFLPIGFFLILIATSFYFNPFITLGLLFLNFFIAKKALGLAASNKIHLLKNEKKNYETKNIYVNLKNNNSKIKIIFIAHWDSKSQTFSPSVRILIFMVFVFGNIIFNLIYLILSIIQIFIDFEILLLNHILLIICIVIAVIGGLNYFNKTDNNSPGAFDNSAAVGTIIELARYFKINSPNNIDFIFLCTSSEELNLGGAKHFIQKYKNDFDKETTYFINFDLIGGSELIRLVTSYGIPRKEVSKKLKDLFLNSAKELNIKIKDIYLPTGAWADYMPIVQEGFKAAWIGSQPGLKYVHTKKDNMDLVSKEGITNALLLSLSVIEKLNNDYL